MPSRTLMLLSAVGGVAGVCAILNFPVTMAVVGVVFLGSLIWRIQHGGLRDKMRWRTPPTPHE